MYILILNDMRDPKMECTTEVCYAETQEEIEDFLNQERVESYRDGHWVKTFRQGGPLEWFNDQLNMAPSFWGHGIHKLPPIKEAVLQIVHEREMLLLRLPNVHTL